MGQQILPKTMHNEEPLPSIHLGGHSHTDSNQ
jgi:hypothetical protein